MWQNKYRGLAGSLGLAPPRQNLAGPSVAPVRVSQPALAAASMNRDLRPQVVPNQPPPVPMLNATPAMNSKAKSKALRNIATGVKGF